jgi:EAL domain-containing protein (putative c-di-GMP-specific phosphodiesterase class I)/GGDEF domain-containing protein/CBS domain-containing protein
MLPQPDGSNGPDPLDGAREVRALGEELRAIIDEDRLKPHYQPILDLHTGKMHGFEGLIRGPSDSLLHSPLNLFKVALLTGQVVDLEAACCRSLLRGYKASGQPEKLFLNISPGSLLETPFFSLFRQEGLRELGFTPDRIVIELTENQPTNDFSQLVRTADLFRDLGFAIAMDDLGEGFSSLRLWSELRPEYVKIDKHFIHGVSQDPVKHQFLHSLRDIAAKTGAKVVAEGIELEADLAVVHGLGLDLGQGYLFGRPAPTPHAILPAGILALVRAPATETTGSAWIQASRSTAARLLMDIAPLPPETPNWKVEQRFAQERELQSVPVVRQGIPVGLINRHVFVDLMAKPFSRELYGKRPCETLMDQTILVVDHHTSLHELSKLIVESDPRHILHGFILTRDGQYAGMGSGHDLMREITQMQIHAARYANPLTGLPGNVPINEHLDDLLRQDLPFVVCYCDLDHFKPYNDVHGYGRGDEVIHWTGKLLEAVCEPDLDFVGHIGGDDFLMILRSPDWERRCHQLLANFEAGKGRFFSPEELARGGYASEDRKRRLVHHPLVCLSIGAVQAPPGAFPSHHEIAAAAATAKKEAKREEGSSLFIERRNRLRELEDPIQADTA